MQFKNIFISFILGLTLTGLILSCSKKEEQDFRAFFRSQIEREQTELKEKVKEENKQDTLSTDEQGFVCPEKEARGCWQLPQCKNFCDESFSYKAERQNCYNWPLPLFDDFKNLIETINTGLFQNIEPKVLRCFLKLSEDNKDSFFRKLNKDEAKELLEVIADEKDLAFHLAKEDKSDFSILHRLFKKIRSRTPSAIKEELHSGDNFLIRLSEDGNRPAWDWLNDYISYRCQRDKTCKEPLDYYCEILEDIKHSELEYFFEYRNFEIEYKKDIESKNCGEPCKYGDVADFRKMCNSL